jgi:entry exclusion lipoprotein TrbK
MPVVNSANCSLEAIKKIKDKTLQQEFSGLCLHSTSNNSEPQKTSGKW